MLGPASGGNVAPQCAGLYILVRIHTLRVLLLRTVARVKCAWIFTGHAHLGAEVVLGRQGGLCSLLDSCQGCMLALAVNNAPLTQSACSLL